MAITSYSETLTPSVAGQLDGLNHDIHSYTNDEATSELPIGTAVVQGTAAQGCKLPSDDEDKVVGIVALTHAYSADELGTTGVKPDQPINAVNRGRVWVIAGSAANKHDRGYVYYAGAQLGRVGAADVTDETFNTSAQIRFLSAASAAGALALVEVDFNNVQAASTVTPSGE